MRVEPNIKTLEKASVHIQQQESDSIAIKGVQDDRQVNLVKPRDGVKLPKKEVLCKICQKTHQKFKCTYRCKHCNRKGHRSEACWTEFPEKAPNYPGKREDTPAPDKLPKVAPKKRDRRASSAGSDRGSEYEHSGNESDSSTNRGGRRQRRRSQRIKTLHETSPMEGTGFNSSESSSSWGNSRTQKPPIRLFRRVKELDKAEKVLDEILVGGQEQQEVDFHCLSELFAGMEYGKQSQFQK